VTSREGNPKNAGEQLLLCHILNQRGFFAALLSKVLPGWHSPGAEARNRDRSRGGLPDPLPEGIPIPGFDPGRDARFGEIAGEGKPRVGAEGNDG